MGKIDCIYNTNTDMYAYIFLLKFKIQMNDVTNGS
jgi:hypothetical protein